MIRFAEFDPAIFAPRERVEIVDCAGVSSDRVADLLAELMIRFALEGDEYRAGTTSLSGGRLVVVIARRAIAEADERRQAADDARKAAAIGALQ